MEDEKEKVKVNNWKNSTTKWVDKSGKERHRVNGVYQKTVTHDGYKIQRSKNRKIGRNYRESDWLDLLERFANGEKLIDICAEGNMPNRRTLYVRIAKNEEFKKAYDFAREMHIDAQVEQAQKIADEIEGDSPVKVARDNLRVNTRKWLASKLNPRKYGDKIQQEISGEMKTVQPVINVVTGVMSGGESDDKFEVTGQAVDSLPE